MRLTIGWIFVVLFWTAFMVIWYIKDHHIDFRKYLPEFVNGKLHIPLKADGYENTQYGYHSENPYKPQAGCQSVNDDILQKIVDRGQQGEGFQIKDSKNNIIYVFRLERLNH